MQLKEGKRDSTQSLGRRKGFINTFSPKPSMFNKTKDIYEGKSSTNLHIYTPRITRRKKKKSIYENFLKSIIPDLMVSDRTLRVNDPEWSYQNSYLERLAQQSKNRINKDKLDKVVDRLTVCKTSIGKRPSPIKTIESKNSAFISIQKYVSKSK